MNDETYPKAPECIADLAELNGMSFREAADFIYTKGIHAEGEGYTNIRVDIYYDNFALEGIAPDEETISRRKRETLAEFRAEFESLKTKYPEWFINGTPVPPPM